MKTLKLRIACAAVCSCWPMLAAAQAERTPGNDRDRSSATAQDQQQILENAKVKLADAIKTAESTTQGKACAASIVAYRCLKDEDMQSKHDSSNGSQAIKPDSPVARVICVKDNRATEVLVCCTSGKVVSQRDCGENMPRSNVFFTSSEQPNHSYNDRWYQRAIRWQKISDIMKKPVTNRQTGERIGDVRDLAIETDNGRILYVVVEFKDGMGHGNRWFAIPNSAAQLAPDYKSVVIDYSTAQMNEANGFDSKTWPDITNAEWGQKVHEMFGTRPYWKGRSDRHMAKGNMDNDRDAEGNDRDNMTKDRDSAGTDGHDKMANGSKHGRHGRYDWKAPSHWQRASVLIGMDVRSPQNENLGDVKDIVVDADSGRVLYGVLSFGGILGIGDKLFAVPFSSFELAPDQKTLTLAIDKDRLKKAEGFDRDHWPNMGDERWATNLSDYYGQGRYWEDPARQ